MNITCACLLNVYNRVGEYNYSKIIYIFFKKIDVC